MSLVHKKYHRLSLGPNYVCWIWRHRLRHPGHWCTSLGISFIKIHFYSPVVQNYPTSNVKNGKCKTIRCKFDALFSFVFHWRRDCNWKKTIFRYFLTLFHYVCTTYVKYHSNQTVHSVAKFLGMYVCLFVYPSVCFTLPPFLYPPIFLSIYQYMYRKEEKLRLWNVKEQII